MDFFSRFIKELQVLEEGTKRKVLVVSTVLMMAIVVYFWAGYFGGLITAIPQEQPVAQATENQTVPAQNAAQTATVNNTGPGLWQNIKNEAEHLYELISGPKQYDIKK